MHKVKLRDICHARSGDKGNSANVGVICYDPVDFEWVRNHVTEERVTTYLGQRITGPVKRFELPNVAALNFMLYGALDGGASRSRGLDIHGKGYSSILLHQTIESEDLPPSQKAKAAASQQAS